MVSADCSLAAQRTFILVLKINFAFFQALPLNSNLSSVEDKAQDRDTLESIGTTVVGNCLLSSRSMVRIHQGAFSKPLQRSGSEASRFGSLLGRFKRVRLRILNRTRLYN